MFEASAARPHGKSGSPITVKPACHLTEFAYHLRMLTEYLKAPVSRLVIFLCVLTLLACPGALVIFTMQPENFIHLNTFQIVVLSVGMVLPFVVLNSIVVAWAFTLHRWIGRVAFNRRIKAPREGVVATSAVFAGSIGALVPAYAMLAARMMEYAKSNMDLTRIAIETELIPLLCLLLINPMNYWKGIDEVIDKVDAQGKATQMAVTLHVYRERSGGNGAVPRTVGSQTTSPPNT